MTSTMLALASWPVQMAQAMGLVVVGSGMVGGLIGWALARRLFEQPAWKWAEALEEMRRSGHLRRLPEPSSGALHGAAARFNELADHIEQQRQRLREQMAKLEQTNAELGELSTLKDDFLATINHQLRTPVTAAVECVELMRDGAFGKVNEEQQAFLQMMNDHMRQMAHLVEEVLDLSLLKSGRRPLRCQTGDLAEILRRCTESWKESAESCSLRLAAENLPPVYMDATAIQEVMDHLLRNAIRHSPPGSEVLIQARATEEEVEVSVRDTGAGMSSRDVAKLFQPFTHVQGAEAPGSQGSGLGLAYCRQVIERHRGTIRAESAEGSGTTVTFSLPIASNAFLFEEAFWKAQEEAEDEDGQFAVLVVAPARPDVPAAGALMRRAEETLRRHTHRSDQLLPVDDRTIVVVAVTNAAGSDAMVTRLRGVFEEAGLAVRLGIAMFPEDGERPDRVLKIARRRMTESRQTP